MMATTQVPPRTSARSPKASNDPRRATRRKQVVRRRLIAGAVVLGVLALAVLYLGGKIAAPELATDGPDDGAAVGAAGLPALAFAARAQDSSQIRWTLDGVDVTATATLENGVSALRPSGLADGKHAVAVGVDSGFPFASSSRTWSFTVDTAPPEVSIDGGSPKATSGRAFTLAGTVEDATKLTVNGAPVEVKEGAFAVEYATSPPAVAVVAIDAAGNATRESMKVAIVPRRPDEPVRGVHVSALAWANDDLRGRVLDMIDAGLINTVELDLKDESGVVGYDSQVPLARKIGAVKDYYDLGRAVEQLHDKGARVIGRLVAFRDPVHAAAAWDAGERAQVIQTPEGEPYAGYGGFTNFADPAVQQYQIDIAREAAGAGVDDILYDYVRRPDGPLDSMVFPGLEASPEEAIAGFLERTRKALRPTGAFLGASVFGISATRPEEIGQDIPMIARHVDYVSPMVYPSHWGPEEYGIAEPNSAPYAIVRRSLPDFAKAVKGKGARVVPWLQDFSLQTDYGTDQVCAQIRGTADAGIDEFLLWDPEVTYHTDALTCAPEAKTKG
jgi:hypothetical protein